MGGGWRAWTAGVAIGLGCLLAIPAVAVPWVDRELTNTDAYLDAVQPLASNTDIQTAVANRVTDAVMSHLNISKLVTETADELSQLGVPSRLVDRIRGLAVPSQDAIRQFVYDTAYKVASSDEFQQIWTTANRAIHDELNTLLAGESGKSVHIQGDSVVMDVGPLVANVKTKLVADGLQLASDIPSVNAQVTLFSSAALPKAQRWYDVINALKIWLPVTAVVLVLAGLLLAPNRRRSLVAIGLGLAVAMVLVLVALVVGRHIYVNDLPPKVSVPAATALFDAFADALRTVLWWILGGALVLALAAYLFGPGRVPTRLRGLVRHN